jgi:tetratricopeptide (TPR) repeat protein
MVLGITFLAANWPSMPRWVRYLAAGFVGVDFCLGVFLQMRMQRLDFELRAIGSTHVLPLTGQLLGIRAVLNDLEKTTYGINFWGDYFRNWSGLLQILIVTMFAAMLRPLARSCAGTIQPRRDENAVYCALLVLLAAGVGYCAMDEFDGSVSSAQRLTNAPFSELRQAIGPAKQSADAAPQSSAAQLALGEALYRAGQVDAAVDRIVTAFVLDNSNPAARYDALLLVYTGTPVNADDTRLFTLAENAYDFPESADDQTQLGFLLLSQHRPQAAIAPLDAAVQIAPNSVDALALLGIANGQITDVDHLKRAIDLLTQALRLRPDSGQIAGALRQCLKAAGGSDADVEAYIQDARGGS